MKRVPDYRCERKKPHDLAEMLVCVIAGYMNGRTSVGRALLWCNSHMDLLRKYMALEHGIASEATISRMLNGIDEETFALVFMEWIAEIVKEKGIHIIMDGKALRGATEKIKDGNTPYVLNAIDAIGTQTKIEEQIADNGGHFVLQVKKNNPVLYEEIITAFAAFEKELKLDEKERSSKLRRFLEKYDRKYSHEKNRERNEYRDVRVCTDTDFLSCVSEGKVHYIKSAGCITQIRIPIEKDKEGNDIRFGTSSRENG